MKYTYQKRTKLIQIEQLNQKLLLEFSSQYLIFHLFYYKNQIKLKLTIIQEKKVMNLKIKIKNSFIKLLEYQIFY